MHRLVIPVAALAWLALSAAPAAADPPGPTDFQSEVVEIDPEFAGIEVSIIGGDSFVRLEVEPGIRVVVVGYRGEPYLRFLANGTVEENAASPSKYLNEDRYAGAELPGTADASAPPEWRRVADGGTYTWHDHRTHWMSPDAPPGRGPGDRVAEGVVPLLVDGVEVDVAVVSVWQLPPSPVPMLAGLGVGGAVGWWVLAQRRHAALVAAAVAGAALAVGTVAYLSVPAVTQPPWSLFGFPLASFLAAVVAARPAGFGPVIPRQRSVLVLLAALQLVVWGVLHRAWLWRAILPTNLPFWLDRFVAAGVLAAAVGLAGAVLAEAGRQSASVR